MAVLQDRRVLITGAGSGIGKAMAALFAREGARLALLDIDKDSIAEQAEALGGVAVAADVRDEQGVIDAVGAAAKALDGLDGLVNAAGVSIRANLEDLGMEVWRRIIDINLTGTYVVCRAALPFLRQAEEVTIVTTSRRHRRICRQDRTPGLVWLARIFRTVETASGECERPCHAG